MIKILKKKQNRTKIKNRGALPQDNTDFSKEPTANIILNGEKKAFFLSQEQGKMPTLFTSVQHYIYIYPTSQQQNIK